MKKTFLISIILTYFVFTQVYPFVHEHSGQDHYDLEMDFFLHGEQNTACDHDNENHHSHSHEHTHHDIHFLGDWDYTYEIPVMSFSIGTPVLICFEIHFDELTEQITAPLVIPLKLPPNCLTEILPDRAPPKSC